MIPPARRAAAIWTVLCAGLGGALAFLYPDSYQQDGGYHFLFARWAWTHPDLFVDVWARPAFTLLYSLPAQAGYAAAKLFTLLVCAACAWQTWRLAVELKLERSALAVPLLFLQPCFLLISSETMTEPIFALTLVIALRLRAAGRVTAGLLAASALILSRPEGALVIGVWALGALVDDRDARPGTKKLLPLACLFAGAAAWWLAAFAISGDPLHILKRWPENWSSVDGRYGSGSPLGYAARLPEIAGPLFVVPCVLGAFLSARSRPALVVIPLAVFLLHSVLWWIGGFGSAGYPRYMVSVSPALALLSLVGWNAIADRMTEVGRAGRRVGAAAVLGLSAFLSVIYVDVWSDSRDAWAIDDAVAAWRENPRPVRQVIWSHAYMAIRFDEDPQRAPEWKDRTENLRLIGDLPSGTLVFWDAIIGPGWFHLTDADFARAGFERLFSRSYAMPGRLDAARWIGLDGRRRQEMHLLYKNQ